MDYYQTLVNFDVEVREVEELGEELLKELQTR